MSNAVFVCDASSSGDSSAAAPDTLSLSARDSALPAPLSAQGLDEQARQAMHALLREGESLNTRTSYQSALRYWAAWHALRYGRQIVLPLSADCVLQFVVDHAQRNTPHGLSCEMPAGIDPARVEGGYK